MHLSRFIEALKADLTAVAQLGDDTTAEAAQRLTIAIQGSLGLRLLDALSEASVELNAQLPNGRVEVRLSGQDPELVFVEDEPGPTASAGAEDSFSARITLRLPDSLKTRIEAAADREGVSTNTWIVRALARGTTSGGRSGSRLTGFAKS